MCGFTYPSEREEKIRYNKDDDWTLPWHQDPNRDYFEDVENIRKAPYDGAPC
jgi:hypothetical protein